MQNKYKKGDWVRVVDNAGAPRHYEVGEVCKVEHVSRSGLVSCTGKSGNMYEYRFEPWQPKVGERVRYVANYSSSFMAGKEVTVVEIVEPTRIMVDTRSHWGRCTEHIKDIEPITDTLPVAEQPAALTIQAGRFYKTRDGRKVGPMIDDYSFDCVAFIEKSGDGRGWSKFGVGLGLAVGDDLVAEWVDTPVTQPVRDITAATVDAINDEYGPVVAVIDAPKFKVGDRVRITGCVAGRVDKRGKFGVVAAAPIGRSVMMPVELDDTTTLYFSSDELTLVESATPAIVCKIDNGQPLPATRPVVHSTVEVADAEAKRLANLHAGQTFGVYALTGTPHKVARVYDHEWQRLAAAGNENAAVASMIKSSGIGPGPAVIAVRRFAA